MKKLALIIFSILCFHQTNGQLIKTSKNHTHSVSSIAYDPKGKYIVSGSWDKTVKLWDVMIDRTTTFKGHTDWVWSVAFSPDSKKIASASDDKTIKLWDIESGKILKTFKGHEREVRFVAFTQDGKQLVSDSMDGTIRVWSIDSGKNIRTIEKKYKGSPDNSVLSPDGKYVAAKSANNTIKLWNLKDNSSKEFKGHESEILALEFSSDSKKLASSSATEIKIRNIQGKKRVKTIKIPPSIVGYLTGADSLAFGNNNKWLAAGLKGGIIKIWDIETLKLIKKINAHTDIINFKGYNNSITSIQFSPDYTKIASGAMDSRIRLWNISSLKKMSPLHYAALSGNLKKVKKRTTEYNINSLDPEGNTPLSNAAMNGHLDVVKYFILNKAKPFVPNDNGETALHLARSHPNVSKFLQQKYRPRLFEAITVKRLTEDEKLKKIKRLIEAGVGDNEALEKLAKIAKKRKLKKITQYLKKKKREEQAKQRKEKQKQSIKKHKELKEFFKWPKRYQL